MKKLLLCLMLVCVACIVKAQGNTETIYLKNGSVINGVVIEQIPNESLKLRTKDGNIFVFQMSEVAKITKDFSKFSSKSSLLKQTGYKGFVDLGYSLGVGDWRANRLEFSTSHGYQFNPYLYLGAGAGLNYFHDGEAFTIPIFANPRLTVPTNSTVTPFLDLKIGYTVLDVEGFYLSPSIGASFAISPRNAINLSLGYTLQNAEILYWDYGYNTHWDTINIGAITFKLGVEF